MGYFCFSGIYPVCALFFDEIKFELLGLENLIKKAEERISMLNQSAYLAGLAINDEKKDLENYFYSSENKNDNNSIFEKK